MPPNLAAEWIQYRLGKTEKFRSTGQNQFRDPETGRFLAISYFDVGHLKGPTPIAIKYADLQGKIRGPYELVFNPAAALIAFQKMVLESGRNSWLASRTYGGKSTINFSHLMSYRGALKEIWYGLDTEKPDRRFAFPPHDELSTASIGPDVPITVEVKQSLRFVTVRLVYKDGTESDVVRFEPTFPR